MKGFKTVNIPDALHKALKKLSAEKGTKLAQEVVEAIKKHLK